MFSLKSASYAAALLGIAASVLLTQRHGFDDIRILLRNAGWPLLWLVPFHLLPLLLDSISWRVLLAPRDPANRARLPYLFWVATVREAVSRLLPLASVGGELVGIRLALLRGLNGAAVTASVLVQVVLSVLNQYLFALLGLGLMLRQQDTMQVAIGIAIGILLTTPIPFIALIGLRHGELFERAQQLLGKRLQDKIGLNGAALDAELRRHFRHPQRLLAAAGWEFSGLVVGAAENWLALRLLGYPVSLPTALSLEAVTQSVRHLFFMVPAGLGVQEVGLAVFSPLLGIPADLAIALSLSKRMREILFGVPALLSWPYLELRRIHQSEPPQLSNEDCTITMQSSEDSLLGLHADRHAACPCRAEHSWHPQE
jgi:putative membrane protein